MVRLTLSSVRIALRNCLLDQSVFGCQMSIKRKISPFHRFETGRIAWGYQ